MCIIMRLSEITETWGYSSAGRAAVSKTVGPEFDPLCPRKKTKSYDLVFFVCAARHNIIAAPHGANERCCLFVRKIFYRGKRQTFVLSNHIATKDTLMEFTCMC